MYCPTICLTFRPFRTNISLDLDVRRGTFCTPKPHLTETNLANQHGIRRSESRRCIPAANQGV
jgi:hypothetical protein